MFKKVGKEWQELNTVVLGTGCYEVEAIDKEIKRQMGWGKDAPVKFAPNNSTLNCVMNVKKDYKVNFAVENSLATVLGFLHTKEDGKVVKLSKMTKSTGPPLKATTGLLKT